MTTRYSWPELPDAVRDAVLNHVGIMIGVTEAAQGQNSEVALTLSRADGARVFLKGVKGISPRMRWLRHEVEWGRLAAGIAPATLFSEDIRDGRDDWFLVGFEHVTGRSASLRPGSADLPLVASTVNKIARLPAPGVRSLSERWTRSDWWHRLSKERPELTDGLDLARLSMLADQARAAVDGHQLVHTDLHEHQFLVDEPRRVRVIDWGWPASGAPWVDTAFLVIRLIAAGHTPQEAEKWASSLPAWFTASDDAVTAFASYVAGLWSYRAATGALPGSVRLAANARDYVRYRSRINR